MTLAELDQRLAEASGYGDSDIDAALAKLAGIVLMEDWPPPNFTGSIDAAKGLMNRMSPMAFLRVRDEGDSDGAYAEIVTETGEHITATAATCSLASCQALSGRSSTR